MLDWAMARPAFKTQLFRFVDVFPAMADDDDVARHLHEYFDGAATCRRRSTSASTWPTTCRSAGRSRRRVARRNIARMAEQFIVGTTPAEAVDGLHALWRTGQRGHRRPARREDGRRGRGRPVRGAGRASCSTALLRRAATWAPDDHLERDDLGPIPRVQRQHQADRARRRTTSRSPASDGLAQAKERLRPILRLAPRPRRVRPLRHGALRREGPHARSCSASCSARTSSPTLDVGIVIQAYLQDSRDDLRRPDRVVGGSGRRRSRCGS